MSERQAQTVNYNCSDCPAYCCSVYERVQVSASDLRLLASHFGLSYRNAVQQFTKVYDGERILRQKADPVFGKSCRFLHPEKRQCTIYEARPEACREFPQHPRCAYYDLLQFEREQQNDLNVVPLVQITFRNGTK